MRRRSRESRLPRTTGPATPSGDLTSSLLNDAWLREKVEPLQGRRRRTKRYFPERMTTRDDFDALVREATSEVEDDKCYWDAVRPLQRAPPEDVWALVSPLAQEADARLRALVPDVLRYLGEGDERLRPRTIELLRAMLSDEQNVHVLCAIATAFVDLQSEEATTILRPLATHPDAEVRLSATHGLLNSPNSALPELMRHTSDPDGDVRNWATFAIGSLLGDRDSPEDYVDTPEVRQVLADRLTDQHTEARAEATLGLALRGDPRAIPIIEQELERGPEWYHYLDAAAHLADPRFLPALERLASSGAFSSELLAALERCRAEKARTS
jgi:HEAT repeat protein